MATTEQELRRPDARAVAEALEPEAGLLADADPLGFAGALLQFTGAVVRDPLDTAPVGLRYAGGLMRAGMAAAARPFGLRAAGPVAPDPRDRRFKDEAWEHPAWFAVEQAYLLWSRALLELVERVQLGDTDRMKAEFAVRTIVDAAAPTNFLASNPTALRRAIETGGASVLAGLRNMASDIAHNHGRPRQVDSDRFTVGENLACTPGRVVFRNDLMELIQYAPQTETTYEIPLVLSPPWINKYYIMDLAPGRSFAEWAVQHGHTVFAISYRNPDAAMGHVTVDDYLLHGPHTALDVMADITGAPQANIVGLCLGGSLTTMLLAYLAHRGENRVRSATLLNTLVDFTNPGMLGSFTDPRAVRGMARRMAAKGVLESRDMSLTFDLLRANDLIWNYVASGWLMGEPPPAFDILAWNVDSTRMPAAMHSFYLRHCYGENQLARGEMVLAGTPLRLDEIPEDFYLLAAKEDHIVPWESAYASTRLFTGDKRFVLSSSGHIAGIVNPPSPKARHWVNDALPREPLDWLAGAEERTDSWWHDWTAWIADRAGDRVPPPSMGSATHPPLIEAPGGYVHER